MKKILILSILLTVIVSSAAFAHSGRTNKYGYHHDYKRGGYHRH